MAPNRWPPEELPPGCVLSNVFEHGAPIAEYVFYVMLLHLTQIEHHAATFRHGNWSGSGRVAGQPHDELSGKTIGILGYGHIGQELARRAEVFGMEVLLKRYNHEAIGFWSQSDFIVIACSLNDHTRGMVSSTQLDAIQDGAMIVNVARAEIIEEAALFRALSTREIYAALDAWYQYPTTIHQALPGSVFDFHNLPNVLSTPHLTAWTSKMIERRMRKISSNLDRLARGETLKRIVLEGPAPR